MKENIISLNNLDLKLWEKWEHGAQYSGTELPLAKLWGAQHLGFHLETLAPGKFGCPYHSHQGEEEIFLVIKGSAILRQEETFRRVSAGDFIFFATGVSHQFHNPEAEPFVFVALSNKNKEDVCTYPDSNKTMTSKDRKILQNGVVVEDYWKDEEDPRGFWPKQWLSPQNT